MLFVRAGVRVCVLILSTVFGFLTLVVIVLFVLLYVLFGTTN